MSLLDAVRRANRPGPPEHSVRLRAACLATVLVAVGASASLGEIAPATAVAAGALVTAGMTFSYVTRTRPPGWIKVAVAVGAVAAFVWFFHSVSSPAVDFTSVLDPLTLLLVSVLVVHSFHVPSRRDLLFSLGASAGLMAVAGAQAIDLRFGLFVVAWVGFGLWALTEMWISASGGGRISTGGLVAALAAVTAAAAAVFLALPAPVVASRVAFLARAGLGGAVGVPGDLAGDAGSPAQLSQAGSPSSPIHVGGYLGFAQSLDTALRGQLGNQVVMQVRADRPSYWVGETFDTWQGTSWMESRQPSQRLQGGSPFVLLPSEGDAPLGQPDLQTFYVTTSTADLVFHADSAEEVWFPSSSLFTSAADTIVSPIGLGSGSIYTVESNVSTPTPVQLRTDASAQTLPPDAQGEYEQLPRPYPRVQSLAQSVTAGDESTYAKVESLIAWIGAHTHYSTDIPPLPPGTDTVDEFLFGNRVGYCEQISTSLAVMLRSLGIPAREAVGYVPGGYNPITDLYQVHADDAHAWVQVWFPGYGWQSFDPTAVVPPGPPSPGTTALRDAVGALRRVPWVPVAAVLFGAGLVVALVHLRRSRPGTWTGRVARSAEAAGRRAGRPRRPSESLVEYAAELDDLTGRGSGTWARLASSVEASAYGGLEPTPAAQRAMVAEAKRTRVRRRRQAAGVSSRI